MTQWINYLLTLIPIINQKNTHPEFGLMIEAVLKNLRESHKNSENLIKDGLILEVEADVRDLSPSRRTPRAKGRNSGPTF